MNRTLVCIKYNSIILFYISKLNTSLKRSRMEYNHSPNQSYGKTEEKMEATLINMSNFNYTVNMRKCAGKILCFPFSFGSFSKKSV